MKARSHNFSLITLALVCASISSFANQSQPGVWLKQEKQAEPVAIVEQTAPRIKLPASYIEIDEDGVPEERIRFQGEEFDMFFEYYGTWMISHSVPAKVSAKLELIKNPDVSLTITAFNEGEVIESLEEESWDPYRQAVLRKTSNLEGVFEHDSKERMLPPIVFGQRNRQIAYDYIKGKETYQAREFWVFLRERLYAFRFSGPKEIIEAQMHAHNMKITRMYLRNHEN